MATFTELAVYRCIDLQLMLKLLPDTLWPTIFKFMSNHEQLFRNKIILNLEKVPVVQHDHYASGTFNMIAYVFVTISKDHLHLDSANKMFYTCVSLTYYYKLIDNLEPRT